MQRRAFDQLQHQRARVAALFQAVDRCDIGMIQRGEDFGFPLEPGESLRVSDKGVGEDFQGHVPVKACVRRPIDDAHPAFAETAGDLEDAEATAYL